MKDQVASYIDRSRLPNEVEPLKDIVVVLNQASLMQQKLVSTDYIFSDKTPFLILHILSSVPQSVSNGLDFEQAK